MKRVIACVAVLTLLVSLFVPVMAAEEKFTPSVANKPAPEIVPVTDPDGKPAIGVIRDEDGDIVSYVYEGCLVVTPIDGIEEATGIPADAKELLLQVYNKLKDGEMKLPYDKYDEGLESDDMVIRDLFDASWLCTDHPELLEEDGNVLEIKFDLGVKKGVDVYAMTYVDGEWNPIVKTVNNGDGTVTCTFDEICPIAFSVRAEDSTPEQTGDIFEYHWLIIAGVALAAIVALTVVYVVDSKKRAAR